MGEKRRDNGGRMEEDYCIDSFCGAPSHMDSLWLILYISILLWKILHALIVYPHKWNQYVIMLLLPPYSPASSWWREDAKREEKG